MGPAAAVTLSLTDHFHLGGIVAGHFSNSANDDWRFNRDGLFASLQVGLHQQLGIALAYLELGLGADCLWEKRVRQDAIRIDGLASARPRWRYSVGPALSVDAGAHLTVWDPVAVEFAIGVLAGLHKISGEHASALGPTSRVGLSYAF